MYEQLAGPLLSTRAFLRRVGRHWSVAIGVLAVSELAGVLGFHFLGGESWIDGFLDSSMLLGGMGLVGDIRSPSGKLFASFFALYAGIVFLGAGALFIAPFIHRVLHILHLDEERRGRSSR
ncbi:MAG: hypothetical protein ACREOU_09505 [Candidatus Eiseniibacteriota bacterium]